jgi:hypothetical protein
MGSAQVVHARRAIIGIRAKLVFALLLACAPMVFVVGWFGLETATNLMRNQAIRGMRDMARFRQSAPCPREARRRRIHHAG